MACNRSMQREIIFAYLLSVYALVKPLRGFLWLLRDKVYYIISLYLSRARVRLFVASASVRRAGPVRRSAAVGG